MPYKSKQDLYNKQKEHPIKNKFNLNQYLLSHPCVHCGESDPVVLEFDHIKASKSYNVGRAVTGSHRSWNSILKEVEKCQVLCANCHRRKTSIQFQWYKAMFH